MSPPQTPHAPPLSRGKLVLYVLQTLALSSSLFILLSLHLLAGLAHSSPSQHHVSSQNFQDSANTKQPTLFDIEPLLRDKDLAAAFHSSHSCYLSQPSATDFCSNVLALANAVALAQHYRFPLLLTSHWRYFVEDQALPLDSISSTFVQFIQDDHKLLANSARLSVMKTSHCQAATVGGGGLLSDVARHATGIPPLIAVLGGEEELLLPCTMSSVDKDVLQWSPPEPGSGVEYTLRDVANVWATVDAEWFLAASPRAAQSSCGRLIKAWRRRRSRSSSSKTPLPHGCAAFVVKEDDEEADHRPLLRREQQQPVC